LTKGKQAMQERQQQDWGKDGGVGSSLHCCRTSGDSDRYSNPAGERFWRETGGDVDGNSISVSSRDFLVTALAPWKKTVQ